MNSTYNILVSTNEPTIVTEYNPEHSRNSNCYQSEADLERLWKIFHRIFFISTQRVNS